MQYWGRKHKRGLWQGTERWTAYAAKAGADKHGTAKACGTRNWEEAQCMQLTTDWRLGSSVPRNAAPPIYSVLPLLLLPMCVSLRPSTEGWNKKRTG